MLGGRIFDMSIKFKAKGLDLKLKPVKQKFTVPLKINFTLDIPSAEIYRYLDRVLDETKDIFLDIVSSEIGGYLDNAMSSSIWGSSDPDIIDSGRLRDSLDISRSSDGFSISYDAPYAALIHYGGYIVPYGNTAASRVYITGKPWMESVVFGNGPLPGYDYQDAFNRAVAKFR